MKTVMITGSTGVMGSASLNEILTRGNARVRLLLRPGKKNRKFAKKFKDNPLVTICWGDLLDYDTVAAAVAGADVVLHMGGMVSPMADRFPEKTLKVNVKGTRNVVNAVKRHPKADSIRLVYIGSVAQTSDRMPPHHWGRIGDTIQPSRFDYYGLSKVKAEQIVAESGLKYWVSLRQSGILHPGLFSRGTNPITFHVPLRGVLEWATDRDSARLMAALCEDNVPEEFWRNFYNIGSGEAYRLTNYEFEKKILSAVGSPDPEKIFEPQWFALKNFHGCWYADSDRLESLVPFRENMPLDDYFSQMVRRAPLWVRLAPLAPAFVVKKMMKKVAASKDLGTLDWLKRNDREEWIKAFYGSREAYAAIPRRWEEHDLSSPGREPLREPHGYDETKPEIRWTLEDLRQKAAFHRGKCLADNFTPGDVDKPIEWECVHGHRFHASPRLVLRGGHWCPDCYTAGWEKP